MKLGLFCAPDLCHNDFVKERLVRLLVVTAVALATFGAVSLIIKQGKKANSQVTLFDPIKKKVEQTAEKILGEAVEHLPKAPDLKKAAGETGQTSQDKENEEEVEPIQQPVNNIEKQTEKLIEIIKELPQDQIEAIRKQLWKDLCEELKCDEL